MMLDIPDKIIISNFYKVLSKSLFFRFFLLREAENTQMLWNLFDNTWHIVIRHNDNGDKENPEDPPLIFMKSCVFESSHGNCCKY